MRSVDVSIVTRNIKEMCIQANHFLSEDMDIAMEKCGGDGGSTAWKADSDTASGELKDCRRGYDPNLSGYWYGGRVHRSWSGGTL